MQISSMIIISILAGLLSGMNMWVVSKNHMRFHLNDTYMIILMTAWMVLFESLYHYNHEPTLVTPLLAIVVIITVIYLIRKQRWINDQQFIAGMIPHHSMAILMAERIKEKSQNPRIIELANDIIKTQNQEIDLMEKMG